jgi:hypothetical protein
MRLQQLAMEIAKKTQQAKDGSGFDGSGGGQSSSRGQSGHCSLSGNVGAEQQGMNDNDDLMGSFNMLSIDGNRVAVLNAIVDDSDCSS